MGLNWVMMGHAPGDRRGYRGHAAFNTEVFWKNAPAIVVPRLSTVLPLKAEELIFKGYRLVLNDIFLDERFQREYRPGYLRTRGAVIQGFFRARWAEQLVRSHTGS